MVIRPIAIFLDKYHWALLLVATPFLLFPTAALSPILFVVPAGWIIARWAGREAVPRTPLNLTLLGLAAMMLVSLYATYDVAVSLPKIAGLVLGLGVFFAVVRLGREQTGWIKAYAGVMVLGVALAALGLLGTQWLNKLAVLSPILNRLPPVLRGLPGAEGGFQPNEVAGTLLWLLPPMLIGVLQAARSRRKIMAGVGSVAGVFVLGVFVLAQSRSGYIGLAAALALMLSVSVPARWRKWLGLAVVVGLVAVGGLVWGRATPGAGAPGDALSLDTLEGRVEIWSRAIYGIEDFPLTGLGLNTFRTAVHVLYPLFRVEANFDLGHAHNEFLQAALDLGLPGLIAFMALYLGAFAMLWSIWREPSGPSNGASAGPGRVQRRLFALGLGGALMAHLVYGLTDAVALGAKPGLVWWMVLGLVVGLFQQAPAPLSTALSLEDDAV